MEAQRGHTDTAIAMLRECFDRIAAVLLRALRRPVPPAMAAAASAHIALAVTGGASSGATYASGLPPSTLQNHPHTAADISELNLARESWATLAGRDGRRETDRA